MDSAIHADVFILPQTPLPSCLPCRVEPSSLCCTVGSCWLSILKGMCACLTQTLTILSPSAAVSSENLIIFQFCLICTKILDMLNENLRFRKLEDLKQSFKYLVSVSVVGIFYMQSCFVLNSC